jgi:hypothetical protein
MCKLIGPLSKNPEKFRSMSPTDRRRASHAHGSEGFHAAFDASMKRRAIAGHVRYCRRYVSHAASHGFATAERIPLLFNLTYLKQSPTQAHARHTAFKCVNQTSANGPIFCLER